jgi:formate hydrogenlyase transcriptional activator
MDALERYSWPGNIRELQNVIERAVILSPGAALVVPVAEMDRHTTRELAPEVDPARSKRRRAVRSILADVDREQIIRALKETVGRVGGPEGAASRLGLKRTTFITRMKKLGINPNAVSGRDATNDTSDTSDTSDRSRVLPPSFQASLGK